MAIRGEIGTKQERAAVITAAREWIRTPYHHAADIKGVGVDCAMLLVRVYVDLGLVEPFDPRPYPRDWMLHRSEERYLGFLLARSSEVKEAGVGDVILFRFGRCYAHGGIVSVPTPLTIIHAFQPYGFVVEEPILQNSSIYSRMGTVRYASYWA